MVRTINTDMAKIKISGNTNPQDALKAKELGADFIGFIFYPKSKRYVGEDFVMPEIPSQIKKVGVFVNDSIENIFQLVTKHALDMVQLHGDESAEFCHAIAAKTKIIKAFGIEEEFDFSILNAYEDYCEYFLFDTKSSDYGGTGNGFDKNILWNYELSKPYFLSGGISLEEVRSRKPEVRSAYALDVNSKFETKPGFKDLNKLKLLKDELSGK